MNLTDLYQKLGSVNLAITKGENGPPVIEVNGKEVDSAILDAILADKITGDAVGLVLNGSATKPPANSGNNGTNGHREPEPSSNPFADHPSRVLPNGKWSPATFKAQADIARRDNANI
jgi:hypothetical protein